MSNLIEIDYSAHWYNVKGEKPEAAHDADLREARKIGLYTSPSSIERDIWKNSFLETWKLQQYALAAASNPRETYETPETYANRIYELSQTKAKTAAIFGKAFHAGVEEMPRIQANDIEPYLLKFLPWYQSAVGDVIGREMILVDHDLGVAGCCDFLCHGKNHLEGRLVIYDWKTQDVKRTDKGKPRPVFYKSWRRQLAFYAMAYAKTHGLFPMSIPTCVSVVIDSNEPSDPYVKEYTDQEVLVAYKQFVLGAYLWFHDRDYWPQRHGKFDVAPTVPMPLGS